MEYIDAAPYTAEPCVPLAPARCGSCSWRGTSDELEDIEDCALDAGDPSPAGRCPDPDCGCIAYLDRPKDRAPEAMSKALKALLHQCEYLGAPTGHPDMQAAREALAAYEDRA